MKKILLAFILLAGLFLTACNGKIEGEITVNIYNESNLVTKEIEFEKNSNLLKVLEKTKEIAIVFEEEEILSVNGIIAKDGYKWTVYLNDEIITDLENKVLKNSDVVNLKQEKIATITVNVYQKGQDDATFKVDLNNQSFLNDVLTSFAGLKFIQENNIIVSVLGINLTDDKYWEIKKNETIITDIESVTVVDGDVVKISALEKEYFNVIVYDINNVEFTKKLYINDTDSVIDLLKNDTDIKLIYNNGVIEKIKDITIDNDYKWVIYLNEVIVDTLDNISIKKDDVIEFKVEEIIVINVEVFNEIEMIYEKSLVLSNDLNLLNALINDKNLEFNYKDGVIKYVRSIFPKQNYKWEVLSDGLIIEDLENYTVTANEEIIIRLAYVPIIVNFEVSFGETEFRVGNIVSYQITILSGPNLGAKVTSTNSNVLQVDGLYLQALAKGEATIVIEIGDSKQYFDITVNYKRYEDMTDDEFLSLTPEEQDEVWEEHLQYQIELRHLEVLRIEEFANNLPNEAEEDLDLILGTSVKSVWVNWESNYPGIITSTGKVNKRTSDTVVTLVLTVWSSEESVTVSREIIVKGFNMAPLPENNLTFAYLPPYNFNGFKEDDIKKIDVINFAAGTISASHKLIITGQNVFFELLKLRERGIRVVVCVQGGSWFNTTVFEEMALDSVTRATFVQSVVDAIELYGFDGIDLDWEIPAPNHAPYFTLLVKDLRTAFDAVNPDLIISAAVPNSNLTSNFEYNKIGPYMDYLHLMNYDLGWKERTSHNSVLYSGSNNTYLDLSVDKTVREFASLGFPKEKMIVGSAFYGKIYRNVFTTGSGLGVSVTGADNQGKTINYHTIRDEYLKINPQYIRRDEIAHANYYYDNINGIFITYDSVNAMVEKTQYAMNNGLGGIMFWDYNQDQTGDLLQAIYQTYPTK